MATIRQQLKQSSSASVISSLSGLPRDIRPGSRIAIAVGSRGITGLFEIVREVIRLVRSAGAEPFIVPAMGSHGGATPAGQKKLLAEYGISEESLGVAVEASLETTCLGKSAEGVDVHFSTTALRSDGIIIINRIKPHTDFSGTIGSGITKMMVIGLGKQRGAATCHGAALRCGFEQVLRAAGDLILAQAPILCGVAIVEDPYHDTALIEVIPGAEITGREEVLLMQAASLMPHLPFEQIDLLIVDEMGKNISGAGLDPNVIGRSVHGYSSLPTQPTPVTRIFVRDLSRESHGNAIGLGLADFSTSRLVRAIDWQVTATNALTSLTLQSAKIPIHYETDREVIAVALQSLCSDPQNARVVRIRDTLSLALCEVSMAFEEEIGCRQDVERMCPYRDMEFDEDGNLTKLMPNNFQVEKQLR